MIDEIKVDEIDVTANRIKWRHEREHKLPVDILEIEFGKNVTSVSNPTVGKGITVRRGFSAVTEDYVFEGIITQRLPEASKIKVVAKGMMIEAIKSRQTYSWDIDIDTEAGVGSEIFKAHCDNAGLYYDSSSIISTGVGSGDKIQKWIQNDEDDLQKMNELADTYDYVVRYEPQHTGTGKVFFEPLGYEDYPVVLNVGIQIPGQIEWIENMEKLINKVKIQGATVYDKIVESDTGPILTLSKTPEDTELRRTNESGTLLTRGQKDVGILGTDFNYYVDTENKKIIADSSETGTLWVRYGAQVPMPVILSNATSIENYGGPKKTPNYKKFFYNDIKDIADAEKRGRAILNKFSTPFNEAENVPISNTTLQTQFIKPGNMLNIVDSYTSKNVYVVAKTVIKSFPHVHDTVTVGDEIWRTADWDSSIAEKLTRLFNELGKNQDILTSITDLDNDSTYELRYFKHQIKDRSSAGVNLFILGHDTFGKFGTQELGDTSGDTFTDVVILQGANTYREFMYDDDFEGTTGSGTAVWDTTNKILEIGPGSEYSTGAISYGNTFKFLTYESGSITGDGASVAAYGSCDGGSNYTLLAEALRTEITNRDSTGVYLKFINTGTGTGYINNVYISQGDYYEPAIYLKMEEQ